MDGRQQYAETGVGAAVVLAAAAFLVYALSHATQGAGAGTYQLVAKFGQAGSLAPGADVKVAGVKVGSVTGIALDPKTFLARTTISVDDAVKLPVDSSIKITSDSLLGGQHVAIDPGGAAQDLKPGQEFANTQGAVDLFGLIGQVIRPQPASSSSSSSGANAAPLPAASSGGVRSARVSPAPSSSCSASPASPPPSGSTRWPRSRPRAT